MELTIGEALRRGIDAHQAGDAAEAEKYYTAILQVEPEHPDANHNMGVLAVDVGKREEAIPFFERALASNHTVDQFWLSYINVFLGMGRFDSARGVLSQARERGICADILSRMEGLLVESTVSAGDSLSADPPQAELQGLLVLYNDGNFEGALARSTSLLERYASSVVVLNVRGACCAGLGHYDQAIESYRKALEIKPEFADGYNNLASAFKEV